jgi:hypothetical protein
VGVYNRADSKYWWMFVEHEPDPRKRRQSTGILKGHETSREKAEAIYQVTDMRLRLRGILTYVDGVGLSRCELCKQIVVE